MWVGGWCVCVCGDGGVHFVMPMRAEVPHHGRESHRGDLRREPEERLRALEVLRRVFRVDEESPQHLGLKEGNTADGLLLQVRHRRRNE
jgi:hypothetical protein